jgi:hypothetical protein
MSEEPRETRSRPGDRGRFGCLTRIALAMLAAVALVIIVGETFDQGDDAKQPARGFNAGTAEEYAPGNVTSWEDRHVFVVRLADGSFLAFYDKSPKQQELGTGCRVRFDEAAQITGMPQLDGFRGAFVEECNGTRTTWRADGALVSGAGYGDLDRFSTSIDAEGDLIVATASRTCTKSRGVNGLPPYEVQTCGRAD